MTTTSTGTMTPLGPGAMTGARYIESLRDGREVWIDGKMQAAVIYERSKLRAGDRIEGPAIVVEMDSTALILPEHVAEVDNFGNILINPK